jgi:hypothetical protein
MKPICPDHLKTFREDDFNLYWGDNLSSIRIRLFESSYGYRSNIKSPVFTEVMHKIEGPIGLEMDFYRSLQSLEIRLLKNKK